MNRWPRGFRVWVLGAVMLFAVTPSVSYGQDDNGDIVIGHRASIESHALGEDRPLLIYTPPGYEESGASFPVLYLLDGSGHFHHGSGVTQFLSENNRMPPMIVVGVPNTSQEGRTRDLTPPMTVPDTADAFPTAGGASAFLDFLTDELRPWVDDNYRTRPFNVLVGHSFGGLFVTQVLIEDAEAFEAYVSISPSLWWDDQNFVAGATSIFEDHPDLESSLYMTMGNEGGTMLAGAWTLTGILETSAPESFRWKWKHMPAEDHGSVPHRSLYDGLEWVFDGWNLPEMVPLALEEGGGGWAEIIEHYEGLSGRFGWEVKPPQGFIDQLGHYLITLSRADDALRAFEVNSELYPESSSVYSALGDGYGALCRWDEARESYGRAISMAGAADAAEDYRGHLEELESRIETGETCSE